MGERHYGLKLYDVVEYPGMGDEWFNVIAFDRIDNNRCTLAHVIDSNRVISAVCEWCKVIKPSKDYLDFQMF